MAAVFGRTQFSVKDTSTAVTVPSDPIARLMYYFDCVCTCVEPDDDYTIRRLRNYSNYYNLSSDDQARLLALCLALSPDKLIGTILFPTESCGGGFSNKFLELSAVQTNMVVSESVLIGGQSKKIRNIMMFEKRWLDRNYLDPLRSLTENNRRPPPRQRNNDSCVIL